MAGKNIITGDTGSGPGINSNYWNDIYKKQADTLGLKYTPGIGVNSGVLPKDTSQWGPIRQKFNERLTLDPRSAWRGFAPNPDGSFSIGGGGAPKPPGMPEEGFPGSMPGGPPPGMPGGGMPGGGGPGGPSPEQIQFAMMTKGRAPVPGMGPGIPQPGGMPPGPPRGNRMPWEDEPPPDPGGGANELDTRYLMSILNNNVLPDLTKQFGPNMTRGQGTNDKLRMFYEDPTNPNSPYGSQYNAIQNSLQQRSQRTAPTKMSDTFWRGNQRLNEGLDASQGIMPKLYSNLEHLNNYGLPGKDQMEQEMARTGDWSRQLLEGGNGQGGVNSIVSQIINQGLPNQRNIEDMTSGQYSRGNTKQEQYDTILEDLLGLDTSTQTSQGDNLLKNPLRVGASASSKRLGDVGESILGAPVGVKTPESTKKLGTVGDKLLEEDYGDVQADPLQSKAASRIDESLAKGGLPDEYVDASRRKILDKSNESLLSRLNKQGGGVTSMSSGLAAELQRRNESDFNDSLISEGYKNYNDLLDKGTAYGEQTYQQGVGRKKLKQGAQALGTDVLGKQAGYETDISQADSNNILKSLGLGSENIAKQADLDTDVAKSDVDAIINSLKTGSGLKKDVYSQKYNTGELVGKAGDTALDRALKGFESVGSSAFPYLDLAGKLGTNYMSSGLNRFDTLAGRGMENLDLIGKYGRSAQNDALDYAMKQRTAEQAERGLDQTERGYDIKENQFDTDARMKLLESLTGGAQRYLTGEQAAGLGQNQQLVDLMRETIGPEYKRKMMKDAASGDLGEGIGGLIAGILPLLLSTERVKESISSDVDAEAARRRIMTIPLAAFRYRKEIDPEQKQRLGWIIERTDKAFANPDGVTVDLASVLGHLVATVQEQQKQIDGLTKRLEGR